MISAYIWPLFIYQLAFPILSLRRVPISIQMILPLALIIPLVGYQGTYSDWSTYRHYVSICQAPGCTYFEPGFDRLTYLASSTIGFKLIEISLWIGIAISFIGLLLCFPSVNPLVLALSLYSAHYVLFLGAIRQALASSLFLLGMGLIQNRHRLLGTLVVTSGAAMHFSGIPALGLAWSGRIVGLFRSMRPFGWILLILLATVATYAIANWLSGLFPRIGETDVGTSATAQTSLGARDAIIAIERALLLAGAMWLVFRERNAETSLLFGLEAAAFILYIGLSAVDRNIAGRMIVLLRVADPIVVWLLFRAKLPVGIAAVFSYILMKSYFTFGTYEFYIE
ncbi:hypothetical protein FJQ54_01995 [Sandaracinobacter neustonicus]|uniref:EpsG family protein n=1 Tax=Sandaracinobacter neustonicus TaxID=1715348 RepID=A0A501XT80_9SPHN|nr:EpsG family protein [Sandaracinobacter neustonicus]TPE63655.1 hypothetical protein FJQ54_01995 [Sandaracinobacter neustonicus]